ncbi:hypothetical protein Tco_0569609 [Tanacetum coccineum]
MTTPVEKRNNNKFCEFHGEVGHNTDECMHLRRQIEELIKNGKLSHIASPNPVALSHLSICEDVVPKVDDVSLVDGVFDGAFGGDGEEDVVMGEGLEEEAMKVRYEGDEDDKKNGEDGNMTLFQLLDFTINNFYWFLHKVEYVIEPKADSFKDLKWSNVPGVKLSSFSESDDTFSCLQALSNLYLFFGGFMFISGPMSWTSPTLAQQTGKFYLMESLVVSATNRVSLDPDTSCQNLGRTSNALSIPRRFSVSMFSSLIASVWASRICDGNFG